MKLRFLFICFILFLSVGVFADETKSQELYNKGMEYVQKAEASQSSSEKKELQAEASECFNDILKNKKTKDTPEAIYAQYELAKIQAASGDPKQTQRAYEALKMLVVRWDRTDAELDKAGFTTKEIGEIKNKVVEIKEKKQEVGLLLDKQNSEKLNYKIIDFLVKLTGSKPGFSYWFAIVLIAIVVKIVLTPLFNTQMRSMKEMQKIQPKIKALQEKYKDDQQKLGQETMALYKEHNINPLSGCLPLLIQMPILFFLFYVIKSYEIQFQKGTFLWIGSTFEHHFSLNVLGQPGQVVWFCGANLAEADLILLVIYIISTFVSMKMNTPVADKQQADQQKMMSYMFPIMFAFLFAGFPSAFLLYWLVFNIFQTIQQKMFYKKYDEENGTSETKVKELPKEEKNNKK
ncbi:MAG: membrane protein insertase YidC [Abditibacteriota bacterium]|nr:membrane protein insertase YidC [Abditibacteriota bacterium]